MHLCRAQLSGITLLLATCVSLARAQTAPVSSGATAPPALSGGDKLLGGYGPYRANNDLLHYALHVRVDPEKQFISGMNAIRFRMLEDGTRIQLDLVPTFTIDGISLEQAHGAPKPLTYQRIAGRSIYVDFPHTLRKGQVYTVDFHYSGHPVEMGRFGGFVFRKDPYRNIKVAGQHRHAAWEFTAGLASRNGLVLDKFVECRNALIVKLTEVKTSKPLRFASQDQRGRPRIRLIPVLRSREPVNVSSMFCYLDKIAKILLNEPRFMV